MGNTNECWVEGIELVQVRIFDNQIRTLTNVRYLPKLRIGILSVGVFDKRGYVFKTNNGVMKIVKGAIVKFKGKLTNGFIYFARLNSYRDNKYCIFK